LSRTLSDEYERDEIVRTMGTTRRDFLKAGTMGTAAALFAGTSRGSAGSTCLRIEAPFHGAILNRRHGREIDDGLKINVQGHAPLQNTVLVNGRPAQRAGTSFTSEVTLHDKETDIIAISNGVSGKQEHRIRAVWDRHSYPRYRFSIDDSFFLRDITQKKYASLFDCFDLKGLRDLHDKYGTRFVLNIYYTTGDDFDLTRFPDQYKREWEDNANWLKLAFHAYANEPARPYQYAAPPQLIADLDRVAEQIIRFAGEKVYSPPTVIHWGMVQPAALKLLFDRGVRVLSGYFRQVNGIWDVNDLLDNARSEYLSRHDALMDFDSGIVFSTVDIVCNSTPVEHIVSTLAPLAMDPNRAEVMDLFTHEQYFWPFYSDYLPDHFERLDVAIWWVTENGYKPVFYHEGFLAKPDQQA
jgi:hypothetical protein